MAAPLAEGPAEYAGILRGERILQIGTMPTSGGLPTCPRPSCCCAGLHNDPPSAHCLMLASRHIFRHCVRICACGLQSTSLGGGRRHLPCGK